MRRNSSRSVIRFGLTAVLAAAISVVPAGGSAVSNKAACYSDCLDHVLNRPEIEPNFGATHELVVTLRVFDDCRKERQVTISEDRSGKLEAVIVTLEASLRHALNECTPEEPCEECCGRIRSHRFSMEDADGKLRGLISELRVLAISPVIEPVIYLHGVRYELWITSVGNESYFRFSGPDPQSAEASEPLEAWARKLLTATGLTCPGTSPENQEAPQPENEALGAGH